jgi:uncharacterized alpha-E superfamily protein
MMLSRIAESLFWMGRYMERAEETARLLDVHFHTLLEQSQQTYLLRWDSIIRMSGEHERFFELYGDATPQTVFEFLGFREDNPNSVVGCIARVRENARTIRDRISRELWEDVNSFYHRIRGFRAGSELLAGPHRFCNEVKFSSHQFRGVADDTLTHDEGWQFLRAGRALERAEKTARIVDVEYHTLLEGRTEHQTDHHQWMAVLKSVAAYEMYRREFHSSIDPRKVAQLLILHPSHPRSIRFNIAELQASLHAISLAAPGTYTTEAERLTGKLHETLLYDRVEDIFDRGLHQFLRDLQRTCRAIGDQIARKYFYYAAA